jgi:hypothetical protein
MKSRQCLKFFVPFFTIIRKFFKNQSSKIFVTVFFLLQFNRCFSIRLAKLIENQPKRSKKSLRCLLHSLDSQRSRVLTPVWRDVWACMQQDCKKDVCIIEAPSLHTTLETYLRKHRFCGECRTKVLKGSVFEFVCRLVLHFRS